MREPEAVKLFVGQVPKDYGESDLRSLFEPFGEIHSLNLLKDKDTGQHRGCAFLTYYENAAAKAAQEDLHEKQTLPGARSAIQVKPAASETGTDNRKLFVGMVSRDISEDDLRAMFEPYGGVENVTILRDPQGKSKGCAFIVFESRLQAQNAIKSLHNSLTMDGCTKPIVVKLADTEKDKVNKKMIQEGAAVAAAGLGLGGVAQQLPQSYYQQLLAQMAMPQIIGANQNIATSGPTGAAVAPAGQQMDAKSAGTVQNATGMMPLTAAAYPGQQYIGSVQQTFNPMLSGGKKEATNGTNVLQPYLGSLPQSYNPMLLNPAIGASIGSKKQGPDGANLFIYQLPAEYTDADLVQTFIPFGNVISAKVFIDKKTQSSKGFGFVSFDNPSSATAAINTMNGFVIGTKRLKVQMKRAKEQAKPY